MKIRHSMTTILGSWSLRVVVWFVVGLWVIPEETVEKKKKKKEGGIAELNLLFMF